MGKRFRERHNFDPKNIVERNSLTDNRAIKLKRDACTCRWLYDAAEAGAHGGEVFSARVKGGGFACKNAKWKFSRSPSRIYFADTFALRVLTYPVIPLSSWELISDSQFLLFFHPGSRLEFREIYRAATRALARSSWDSERSGRRRGPD